MDESRSKEHGRWLNRAICLRPNRRTRKHEVVELTECLYDELGLGGYRRAAKVSALNCILSNLYLASWLGLDGVPVMFSRRSTHYSIPRRYRYGFFTRHIILPIIDSLEKAGFVKSVIGCNDLGKVSRMWATEELLERLQALAVKDIEKLPPPDPIIMKKRVRKGNSFVNEPADYKDTAETKAMRQFLRCYNSLMDETTVKIELPPGALKDLSEKALLYLTILANGCHLDDDTKGVLKTLDEEEREVLRERGYIVGDGLAGTNCSITCNYKSLHRVFNQESWKLGGRFYGSMVQNLPKELRRYITLNGEPTVEPDYSSMHVRMLYHLRGLETPGGDLYDFGGDKGLNKLVALIVINCEPEHDEVRAVAAKFRDSEKRKKLGDEILKHDYIGNLINDFRAAHPAIAEDFCSGCGPKLQYRDSLIMEDLLKHFVGKGVPIIPVHDSLIVSVSYVDEARQVMKKVYKNHLGFDAVVG
ncbi:MAG: hypothetical protein V3U56_12135 [Syntrophobacteria bacterium]